MKSENETLVTSPRRADKYCREHWKFSHSFTTDFCVERTGKILVFLSNEGPLETYSVNVSRSIFSS